MAKPITNVETFVGILFIFAILSIGVMYLGNDVIDNDNANLDNDSISYIADLSGVDNESLDAAVALYRKSKSDKEESIAVRGNETQGNPKDEGLEFLFAKEKAFDLELTIKRIFNVPSFIIVDLLRFDAGNWEWILNIVGWLLTIAVIISVIFFIRGVVRQN